MHSHQQHARVPFSPYPQQCLPLFFGFWIEVILAIVRWPLSVPGTDHLRSHQVPSLCSSPIPVSDLVKNDVCWALGQGDKFAGVGLDKRLYEGKSKLQRVALSSSEPQVRDQRAERRAGCQTARDRRTEPENSIWSERRSDAHFPSHVCPSADLGCLPHRLGWFGTGWWWCLGSGFSVSLFFQVNRRNKERKDTYHLAFEREAGE